MTDCKESKEETVLGYGSFVVVDKDKKGKVCWVGENKYTNKFFGAGMIFGVFLKDKRGTMDGTYKGEKFFRCTPGHGVMVKRSKISKILVGDEIDFNFDEWDRQLQAEAEKETKMAKAKKAVSRLRRTFSKMDLNGDRLVAKEEFVEHILNTHVKMCKDDAESLFKKVDVTGNGCISMAEYDAFLKKVAQDEEDGIVNENNRFLKLVLTPNDD